MHNEKKRLSSTIIALIIVVPLGYSRMVQLDCGLVRTEGLAPRSTEGKIARKDGIARKEEFVSEGRVFGWLTEQEDLGRMEGFRVVDGMEGSGLEERVRLVGWKGLRL
jgi:hypothetical protein